MYDIGRSKGLADLRVTTDADSDFNVFYEIISRVNRASAAAPRDQPSGEPWIDPRWLTNMSQPDSLPPGLRAADIEQLRNQICKLYEPVRNQLRLALLELALFHPDDDSGLRFYSFLVGYPRALERYLKQVKDNLFGAQKIRARRVPLFPSAALYESPYFVKMYETGQRAPELVLDKASIMLVEYRANEETTANYDDVREGLQDFFDDVIGSVLPGSVSGQEGALRDLALNLALLVPVLRPAAFQIEERPTEDRLRGGGLFLYGERSGGWWHDRHPESRDSGLSGPANVSMRSLHGLLRGIMLVSYSRADEAQREHSAYIAHGHEIRKFVGRIGESSPASMLALIKSYFTFMFAAADVTSDLSDYLATVPLLNTEGVGSPIVLDGFVKTAYRTAGILEGALFGIENYRAATSDTIFLAAVRARFEVFESLLDCVDIPQLDLAPKPEDKWAFFSALVCVFRNTIEHNDNDHKSPITVTITESLRHLVITNRRRSDDVRHDSRAERKQWLGSTVETAKHYVGRYKGGGFRMEVDSNDEWAYNSQVPIPESA